MGHFAYTRSPGGWIALSVLFASEMEDLDGKLFKAINGDEGGSWTPSSQIVLGGAGLKIIGPVEGTWTPATQIVIQGAGLEVTGPSSFPTCQILGFAGTTLAVWEGSSTATFGGTSSLLIVQTAELELADSATFRMQDTSTALIGGINWGWFGTQVSHVGSARQYDSACTSADAGTNTRTGPTIYSGNGAACGRRIFQLADNTNSSLIPSHYDIYRVGRGTVTQTITLQAPANNITCETTIVWWNDGSDPTGSGSPLLGPAQSASSQDLVIVADTGLGPLALVLPHHPSTQSAYGLSCWTVDVYFDGSAWNVKRISAP
jgi:hypothetical protein